MIVDAHNDLLVEVAHFRHEAHPFRDRWLDQLRRGGVGSAGLPGVGGRDRAAGVRPAAQPHADRRVPSGRGRRPRRRRSWCATRRTWTTALGAGRIGSAAVDGGRRAARLRPGSGGRLLAPGRAHVLAHLEPAEPVRRRTRRGERRRSQRRSGGSSSTGSVRSAWSSTSRMPRSARSSRCSSARRDAPVVVSHACCRAVFDTPRNLTDDQLRALATTMACSPSWASRSASTSTAPSLGPRGRPHRARGRCHGHRPRRHRRRFHGADRRVGRRACRAGVEPHARRHVVRRRRARFPRARRLPGAGRGAWRHAVTGAMSWRRS